METDTYTRDLIDTGALAAPVSGATLLPFPQSVPRLLSLDAHGRVLDWINWQDAACLYARDAVSWTLGEPCIQIHGGVSRITGERSVLDLHPIIAARGHAHARALDPTPTLTNTALFARDAQLCLYCGQQFSRPHLTRDHVMPLSRADATAGRTWSRPVSTATRARATARRSRPACHCWRCPIGRAGSNI